MVFVGLKSLTKMNVRMDLVDLLGNIVPTKIDKGLKRLVAKNIKNAFIIFYFLSYYIYN